MYFHLGIVLSYISPAMQFRLLKPKIINKSYLENQKRGDTKSDASFLIIPILIGMGCLSTMLPQDTSLNIVAPLLLATMLLQ